jgi:hypothetical protein
MAQAFARRPFEALSDELQRMSYAIAAAVDVLDAGVLEPRDRERLIARLQRRVRYAVGTLAHAIRLADARPHPERDLAAVPQEAAADRSGAQALHFIPLFRILTALHAVSATT